MTDEELGALIGDEEPYFCYSATLRIWGDIPDPDAISRRLGLEPTHAHRKGDKRGPRSPGHKHDQWSYMAPSMRRGPWRSTSWRCGRRSGPTSST